MAYSKEIKDKVFNLLSSGIPIIEISNLTNISRQTISAWNRKLKKDNKNVDNSIEKIKEQISTLSNRKPTNANTKKIAMLTNSLSRLEKLQTKERKAKTIKSKQKIILTEDVAKYKVAMLEDSYGLYNYQKKFLRDDSRFRVWLKSRQIGATYVCAGECLADSMSGMDQLILSASEDQALKWYGEIEAHAKSLDIPIGGSKDKITVPSGATIYIFANNFRTIQGFSGSVWMDEFAWYLNPKRIWEVFVPSITSKKVGESKARITILSTPFEQDSLFHKLIVNTDKYYMFSRHRTDIYEAVKDGLDVDIQILRDLFEADSWGMMYECIFADDESSFFPIKLIKSCVQDYSYYTPSTKEQLFCGYDIGRTKDVSALSSFIKKDTNYKLAMLEVIKRAKFEAQKIIIKEHLNLYQNAYISIDRTGIGMDLAEHIEDRYSNRAVGVYFTASSKETMVLTVKKMLEDKKLILPNDPILIADIHAIKRKAGAKRMLYDADRNSHGHADRFWSIALALKKLDYIGRDNSSGGGATVL